jgi:putative ABC transport system ATP-binding protein
MTDPLIAVRTLTKTYALDGTVVHALRGVTLDVDRGEFVSVIGPSGSGKSTLMHILGCLDQPTTGQYLLDGRDVSRLPDDELSAIRNRRIGFVFQAFNLLPRTSAVENVELPLLYTPEARPSPADRRRRATRALEAVGLVDRAAHHPSQLSGGQQQRVAIARALLNDPSILLADEPTGNLDEATASELQQLIRTMHREHGLTSIIVTHNPVLAALCDRIERLEVGRLVSNRLPEGSATQT